MSLACRRCLTALTRHSSSSRLLFSSSNSNPQSSFQPLKSLLNFHLQHFPHHNPFESAISRNFSSNSSGIKNPKIIVEDETTDDEEYDSDDGDNIETASTATTPGSVSRAYFVEDKIQEAADIVYKVIGPLQPSDRVFKPYEPAFAVVQIGSHQFKVSNGDSIYVEKIKYCEVNDKLILNKVLMVGSPTQTIIGRPILPEAAVRAVVEEHALDAKVIIFKKKRRKNYRRTKGHRQELTRLRITDVQGIEKPEVPSTGKAKTSSDKKVEKVAVAA